MKKDIFEAKLNLPDEYINKVRQEAQESGFGHPGPQDFQEMSRLGQRIFQLQSGHEDELTEVGIDIIKRFYGSILDGVKLDVKIVDPNDEEKKKMAQDMLQQQEEEEEYDGPEVELELPGIEHDIDKRKLINNVMQGEAQNVHDMMYDVKDKVTEITGSDELLDLYMQFLALNRKFDWDERMNLEEMMEQAPQMANAMETEWDEEGEGEGDTPTIKARVLDLPMVIHEVVKGIYELIAAGAIDPDPVRAQKVLAATDTLTDEQEDIRFGPYIARDLRDYVNDVAENISGAFDIPNLREFIFGKLIELPAKEFVEAVTDILMKEDKAKTLITKYIKEIQEEFAGFQQKQIPGYEEEREEDLPTGAEEFEEPSGEEDDEISRLINKQEEVSKKEKKWVEYGQNELKYHLNQAIEAEDWDKAQEISKWIKEPRSGIVKESLGS